MSAVKSVVQGISEVRDSVLTLRRARLLVGRPPGRRKVHGGLWAVEARS